MHMTHKTLSALCRARSTTPRPPQRCCHSHLRFASPTNRTSSSAAQQSNGPAVSAVQQPASPIGSASSGSASSVSSKWHRPIDGQPTNIQVYNCVAKQKVPLVLRNGHFATWYSCGPTVYDSAHIGHASCYVKQDIVQRTLRDHFGIALVTAMNITDVDDKIIERSVQTREPWQQLTQRYETEFWDDLTRLGCVQPNIKLRVSEHIPQIVAFVQTLLEDAHAYRTDDGSVYFEVDRHPNYGKLQRAVLDSQPESKSLEGKRGPADFALWKGRSTSASQFGPLWPVPWSSTAGRPGWHIECSTMASSVFGRQLDFHAGGLDLRFPHHENEEAQSCAYHHSEQWVNYWIHTGQLTVQGTDEKMSKSLRNTIGIAELLRSYSAAEFRMLCLLSNYHNPIEYGTAGMDVARAIVQKLNVFASDCDAYIRGTRPVAHFDASELQQKMSTVGAGIDASLRDNFNTSKSVEHLIELLTYCNRAFRVKSQPRRVGEAPVVAAAAGDIGTIVAVAMFVERYRNVWGLPRMDADAGDSLAHTASVQRSSTAHNDRTARHLQLVVDGILRARQNIRSKAMQSRKQELFLACDEIRDGLRRAGVQVKDNNTGKSTWTMDESALLAGKK